MVLTEHPTLCTENRADCAAAVEFLKLLARCIVPPGRMRGMEPTPTEPGLFAWLFDRDYFKSLRYWRWDVLVCSCLAAVVTPADPVSLLIVFVPLTAAWLLIRYAIVQHFSKTDRDSRFSKSE
jgi:hypothetical protein